MSDGAKVVAEEAVDEKVDAVVGDKQEVAARLGYVKPELVRVRRGQLPDDQIGKLAAEEGQHHREDDERETRVE